MEPATPVDDPPTPAVADGRTAAMDQGDIVNLMASFRRRIEDEAIGKLTDVQNRLVMQRLEDAGTWDKPRDTAEEQVEEIATVIATVTGMGANAVEAALRGRD